MATATAAPPAAPPLSMAPRLQLSAMMFLQFAVWGAWANTFYDYVQRVGFDSSQAGELAGNMALGAIISSLVSGYVADRLLNAELLMGVCHLAGAGVLYAVAQTDPAHGGYEQMFVLTLSYALLYNPTLVLANALTFRHVPDGQRDFPGIRVLGTVGWIAAGLVVDHVLTATGETAAQSNKPILLAAGLSAALGLYSLLVLPRTPPLGKAGDGIPILRAFGLFRDPSFAVFFVVSLIITVALSFYYGVAGRFLNTGAKVQGVNTVMALGQVCELIFLPLLPLFLRYLGMKWVLALGMLCWGLRYLCFSQAGPAGLPYALAITGVVLHGFCFDFFFAAGFIHCDNEAPRAIRASAQALFSFLTYGVGMWLGSILAGRLEGRVTTLADDGLTKVIDWQTFWLVPAAGVLACLVVFVLGFRIRSGARQEPRDAVPGLSPLDRADIV